MLNKKDKDIIFKNYDNAKKTFSSFNINIEEALGKLAQIPISIPCWQCDDVTGLEKGTDPLSGGGIQATGNYPGKARNWDELKQDLSLTLKLIPGNHRVNVHAMYANTNDIPDRDKITIEHFKNWIDWAKEKKIQLDFNGSFFSHPLADSGFTLSSSDSKIREFWIKHGIQSRIIAEEIGKALNSRCIVNLWIPDGYKDMPADRFSPRQRLKESLDIIFEKKLNKKYIQEAVESKLFGIGSEAYVVGSHEFYMVYAMKNNIMLCLDVGHFHPTESIADKISSILTFSDELLLHLSRGVRWDSDHVVVLNDEIQAIAHEISRMNAWNRINTALDFFDASINRIAALVIGTRAALKAILISLLEPIELIKKEELKGNHTSRLALMEEIKLLPYGDAWDMFCIKNNVPAGAEWLQDIQKYENEVLLKRK